MEIQKSPLLETWDLQELRYSFVWEDYRQIFSGLALLPKNSTPNPASANRILSIGSAGDNAISLLLTDAEEICVIDLSFAQIALIELKLKAIKLLNHQDFLQLMFAYDERKALNQYQKIRSSLSRETLNFWDSKEKIIQGGLHYQGRLDLYFVKFRQKLKSLWSTEAYLKMLHTDSLAEQFRIFSQADLSTLANLVGQFFSRSEFSRQGRHESQFKFVEQEDLGSKFMKNFMSLIGKQLISKNPYLFNFLSGGPLLNESSHPLWVEAKYLKIQASLRQNPNRLTFLRASLEEFLQTSSSAFDFMNLSDIFEYLSDEESQSLFSQIAKRLHKGGILAYWTLFVPRLAKLPELSYLEKESKAMSTQDSTWFYSGFHLFRSQ